MNDNWYENQYDCDQKRWYETDGMNWQKTVFIIAMVVIAFAVLSVIAFCGRMVSGYNDLVDARENVNYAEAQVETMMQRRIEMVPDLFKVAEVAADHEKEIYLGIANAQAALIDKLGSGDIQAISEADNELTAMINEFFSIVEKDYPEIGDSKQYIRVMDEISGSVTRIAMERENYNSAVTVYNKLVMRFPGTLLARMFGFQQIDYFQADESADQISIIDID